MVKKFILLVGFIIMAACTRFPTSINNIEQGKKTRPLSVLLDKPDAAPGDTVGVTFNFYVPDTAGFTLNWQVALDYRMDMMSGTGVEGNVVLLDGIMFDDSLVFRENNLVTHRFRFVVPESTLAQASTIPEYFTIPVDDSLAQALSLPAGTIRLSRRELDHLLKTTPAGVLAPYLDNQLKFIIDMFLCKIVLRAKIRSDINLDVVRSLTVRYSKKYHPQNLNHNPVINALMVIKVNADISDLKEIAEHDHDTLYLYSRDPAHTITDSIVVDASTSYFLEINHEEEQEYYYYRVEGNGTVSTVLDTEEYYYEWRFSNLDYSDMAQDSLILIWETMSGCQLLPPVDTDMHNLYLYVSVRDNRAEWGSLVSPGIAYIETRGYFKYTQAYKEEVE